MFKSLVKMKDLIRTRRSFSWRQVKLSLNCWSLKTNRNFHLWTLPCCFLPGLDMVSIIYVKFPVMIYILLNIGHTAFATSSKQSHLQSFKDNSTFCTSNTVYSGNEALYYFRYPVLRIFALGEERSGFLMSMTYGNVNVKCSDWLNQWFVDWLIVTNNKS